MDETILYFCRTIIKGDPLSFLSFPVVVLALWSLFSPSVCVAACIYLSCLSDLIEVLDVRFAVDIIWASLLSTFLCLGRCSLHVLLFCWLTWIFLCVSLTCLEPCVFVLSCIWVSILCMWLVLWATFFSAFLQVAYIIALFPSFRFFVRSIIRLAVISGGVTHFLTYL